MWSVEPKNTHFSPEIFNLKTFVKTSSSSNEEIVNVLSTAFTAGEKTDNTIPFRKYVLVIWQSYSNLYVLLCS